MTDAPAGDFDYETGGGDYAARRRADPRIAATVHAALGDARTVLNVGAGAGSYEPADRTVVAIEPSARMRSRRPLGAAPAVIAVAEDLPFDDDSFDAAMAMSSVHQWPDLERGLAEMRRVARGPVVVLTFDPDTFAHFWLHEYGPEMYEVEVERVGPIKAVRSGLGGSATVEPVPIPFDCTDGFVEAFYGRPEELLDPEVRAAQSAWGSAPPGAEERMVEALRADLDSGAWDERHGHLRTQPDYVGSLTLVVGLP